MSMNIPILPRGAAIPAEHYGMVTDAANRIRYVTGDKRYIAADIRSGTLTIRFIGALAGGTSGTDVILAKITSSEGAVYQWTEQVINAENQVVDKNDPALDSEIPAIEINGVQDIPDEAIVMLSSSVMSDGSTIYLFEWTRLPEGTGQYKVLQLDADDKPVWDWVRAH